MHNCDISRYFHFCNIACNSPSKRPRMHTCKMNRNFHLAVCSSTSRWICMHSRQHEVLTRAERILASTADAGPAFTRHWCRLVIAMSSKHHQSSCYCTQPSKHEALNQCWFNVGPASQTVGQQWPSIGSIYCVCWECWQAISCFEHRRCSKTK